MRTEFSSEQLSDPGVQAMEKILRKCVHCGFCNATCPTFQLTGDELDGPRGRIYLIKDMLERESTPTKDVVKHLDRCLSCLSCMTTCPSGVDYMHLVDHSRAYIEQNYDRAWFDSIQRTALATFLPSPGRFRWLMKLAKLVLPMKGLLPAMLASSVNLAAGSSITSGKQKMKELYLTDKQKKGSVALLPGCAQQVIGDDINRATIRLLNRFGFDVHILSDTECCGAIEHHLGLTELAEKRIKSNLMSWSSMLPQLDAIISNASGCGTMLKDYGNIMREECDVAKNSILASEKTMDICEFLWQQDIVPEPGNIACLKVAYQSPCSMHHGQKIITQPVQLLEKFGFDVAIVPETQSCCGSAGTYNILQPAMAQKLGQRKINNIESTQADLVASGNLGCMIQLRQYSSLPFVHTVELLDWASGGPAPAGLEGKIKPSRYNAPFK